MKVTGFLFIIGLQIIWCFENEYRILGGEVVTNLSQVPYQIQYGPHCGGVLLSEYWAITAAHCGENDNYIVTGSLIYNEGTIFQICEHHTYPIWNSPNKRHTNDYDFQLLKLCSPVQNCQSRPAVIGDIEQVKVGATVVVSGWGHTTFNARHMERKLRRVLVPVMSLDDCSRGSDWIYKELTERMFCAGFLGGKKDACQGDSGGPATIDGKLVGLVSFGVGCGDEQRPGVYANVLVVRSWIRSVTRLSL